MIRGWFGNNFELFRHGIHNMPIGQTDLTRLRKGLIGGQFWSAFIPMFDYFSIGFHYAYSDSA